jgi:hypothetical protein
MKWAPLKILGIKFLDKIQLAKKALCEADVFAKRII